jgi:predicted Zn-dependent peptidase
MRLSVRRAAVERHRIPRGPRLVIVRLPRAHSVAISVHVKVGSRFESAKHNGISHFLEHMLHRGTPRHPSAHALALAFERLGATLSAATYVDHGVLSVSAPPESALLALDLLSEVCREPVYDSLALERGIVREEILESLDAQGRRIGADDLLREAIFPEHALGRPITGTLETLERFDVPTLRRHHLRHYTSSMVVTVAGPLPAKTITARVRDGFHLPRGSEPTSSTPKALKGPIFQYCSEDASQTALRLGFRAPGERDADEPALELILRVLDDGMSTRLYHRLCDERGLCYDVSAMFEAYEDTGLLDFAADTSHANAPEVLSEILAITDALRREGPTADEIEKARARLAWQLREIEDSPSDLAAFYGLGELTGFARTPEERVSRVAKLSRAEIREAAARTFRRERLAVVAVGKLDRRTRARMERTVAAY